MIQAKALIKMARPKILPGGIAAYTLGAAMAYWQVGLLDGSRFFIGLLITEVANLVAHYADEYADVDTDTLARRTWFSGGSGVLPSGVVPPIWAVRAALVSAVFAVGLTAWFTGRGILTWHTTWIVGAGLVGGWFYSMPPVALERRGLGELDNALIGSFLMPLLGYTAQTGAPTLKAFVALVPIFFIVMVGLLGAHWPDRVADAAVGKRSLVVSVGDRMSRQLHRIFTVLTYLSVLLLTGPVLPLPVSLAIGLTLPVSIWATVTFVRSDSPVPSSVAMMSVILAASIGWFVSGRLAG